MPKLLLQLLQGAASAADPARTEIVLENIYLCASCLCARLGQAAHRLEVGGLVERRGGGVVLVEESRIDLDNAAGMIFHAPHHQKLRPRIPTGIIRQLDGSSGRGGALAMRAGAILLH